MTINSTITHGVKGLFATGLLATLVACGGGGGGSSSKDDNAQGSEPVVARGVITQIGSIKVGGVTYETPDGNSYSSDDSTSTVASYQVGQVVSLRGRRNDDGVTGTATEVEYEAEIEGAATGGAINGVTILITGNSNTLAATLNSGALIDSNRYEVSGMWLGNSLIEATFIKDDDDTDLEDEIKGYVEASTATTITVRGVTYTYDGVPAVSTDDFVEIHFDPITLTAPAGGVELEDDYFDQAEDLEVEIEGAVDLSTAGCPPEAEFKIDGVCIDSNSIPAEWMDGLTAFADLAQGSRAEAEGRMISNPTKDYLLADKVKGRGNRIRVSSIAGGVVAAAGTFELIEGNIDVTTMDGVTVFEDGLYIDDTMVPPQNILGQTVEVRGVSTGNPGEMLAIRIKLTGLSGGGDRHELRAEVDENGTDTVNNRLTVMGITTEANGSTELEDQDVEIAPGDGTTSNAQIDAFLGEIDADANAANGPRDVVEMGFDITTGDGTTTPYIADEWEIEDEDD